MRLAAMLVGIFASSVIIFLAGHAYHMLPKKEPPVALAVTAEELETGETIAGFIDPHSERARELRRRAARRRAARE